MRFQQTKEIIEHTKAFHHQLQVFCQQVSAETEQERVKMLCDYIARHERNLERALDKYESDASDQILEAWFDAVPDLVTPSSLNKIDNLSELSTAEVLQIAIDFDDHLIVHYEHLAKNAMNKQLKIIFKNLLSMEEHEKRRMIRDALRLEDN